MNADLRIRVTPDVLVHSTETDASGLAQWQDKSIDQAQRLGYTLAMTEWNLNGWWRVGERRELWPGPGGCGLGAAVMIQAMLRRGDVIELATLHRLRFLTQDEAMPSGPWTRAETETLHLGEVGLKIQLPGRSATILVLPLGTPSRRSRLTACAWWPTPPGAARTPKYSISAPMQS